MFFLFIGGGSKIGFRCTYRAKNLFCRLKFILYICFIIGVVPNNVKYLTHNREACTTKAERLWVFLATYMKDTKISIFKDLYKAKDVPYIVLLETSLKRIKDGKSKDFVNYLRTLDFEKYQIEKKKLPCICFNGQFKERSKNGLIEHSGLMVVDFDKYPNVDVMFNHLETLKLNKHIVTLFLSPSGTGIKGLVKIPKCDANTHEKYFKEFDKIFNYDYFDKSNCNVDRVCFESFDPGIYINYDAEVFAPILNDEGYSVNEKPPLVPINDEMIIIDKIMDFAWKKDFKDGERNSFVFDLAGMFCEYGISENTAEGYLFNNVCIFNNDFTEHEAKNAIKSAYRKRKFDCKYFEDYQKINKIKIDLKKGKKDVIETYNISEDIYNEIKVVSEAEDFWFINEKNKIGINSLKFKLFLEGNGFKKYFPEGGQKPTWVHIKSNIVTETSVEKIKDYVLNYLIDRKEIEVWNYCASFSNLFSETYLLMLESIELLMLKDTVNTSYIAFLNGILTITKNSFELKDYIDVDGYVWHTQIIKRNFTKSNSIENDYKTFITNISNKDPRPIESVIGYLLCNYKNKMNNKAVILNDEVITNNPEGGTGKGLFVQGLKQIRKTSILDGKNFDDKKSFPYQTVSQDTDILVFDDVKKNWDFESKFSLVTEGITLERKNKDAIKLSVEDSPKLVVSTNYAIKGEGNSHDRRRHEIEISQYYGKDLTPYDEFKRELFDDWNDEEFNNFYNYMVKCIQIYLGKGLIKQNAINIKLRKLMAETSMEFYEWITESANIPFNKRNDKNEFYEMFKNDYEDFKKWLNLRTFTLWVQKYASYSGYEYKQGRSNGIRWFEIVNKNEPTIEDEVEF